MTTNWASGAMGLCLLGAIGLLSLAAEGCHAQPTALDLTGQNPKDLLADHYEPVVVEYEARVPAYRLPLSRAGIANPNHAPLRPEGWEALLRNGFVVLPYARQEDMVEVYKQFRQRDVPVLVTTDTVLHLYHIQFDETLKAIEERDFHPRIVGFSTEMLRRSQADYERLTGELKEAARRNVAYFSVALSVLTGEEAGPEYVRDEVAAEMALIERHAGFTESPVFKYKEDYSQYVPRGHYTRSELLKRYFKGLMWYGRISMLLKGETDRTRGLIPEADARVQTLQACLIAAHLYGSDRSLVEDWNRIYGVTAFYVGVADDLTPYEYAEALAKVAGASVEWAKLATDEGIHALRSELATYRSPRIYGGTGDIGILPPFTPEQLDEALEDTKGMRLMGQRFIPDSFMFQQLVFPQTLVFQGREKAFTTVQVPEGSLQRGFPRGLDVMAVMGSERALAILQDEGDTAYLNYDRQLAELREQFAAFTEAQWNRNLYWSWLYALQALIEPCGEGYPTFMQTEAWQDRRLWAALASWAELRHDTILYAKQSYTLVGETAVMEPPPPPPPSYVEPAPEFYARLLALSRMTRDGLAAMDVLDGEAQARLDELESILDRLMRISVQELRNEKLSEEDYGFIDGIAEQLERVVLGVEETGMKTTMVADVHTDGNTREVLEEGVGYVHLLVAAYPVPDGRIAVGVGPVLSQYEFKQPMSDRLTDEAWRRMLDENPPAAPKWVGSFVVQ